MSDFIRFGQFAHCKTRLPTNPKGRIPCEIEIIAEVCVRPGGRGVRSSGTTCKKEARIPLHPQDPHESFMNRPILAFTVHSVRGSDNHVRLHMCLSHLSASVAAKRRTIRERSCVTYWYWDSLGLPETSHIEYVRSQFLIAEPIRQSRDRCSPAPTRTAVRKRHRYQYGNDKQPNKLASHNHSSCLRIFRVKSLSTFPTVRR